MAARKSAKKAKATRSTKTAHKALTSIKKPLNTSQTLNHLALRAELKRKQVAEVIKGLSELVEAHIKKNGPGIYTLPGLVKIKVVRKPATKARKGTNPFTGEETIFKAKPARNVIKVRPLKKLKDMVA
ncbi:MAG: HU family DNA-binding protein [Gammaproteobacteria bacterium]